MGRHLTRLFAGLVVALTLLGHWSPPARGEGTLRLALAADPRSLDPAQIFSEDEGAIAFALFDRLLDTAPDGSLRPRLAEALPKTSPDGHVHTFQLRRGVRFSNGAELTSADVVHSLERLFDPGVNPNPGDFGAIVGGLAFAKARDAERSAHVSVPGRSPDRWISPLHVEGLESPDPYTVRIRLDKPDLAFLKLLTLQSVVCRNPPPPRGEAAGSRQIGSGLYAIQEWRRGARLRLVRNPFASPGAAAAPEEIDYVIGVDPSTQSMMFERGEIDVQVAPPEVDLLRFRKEPRTKHLLRTTEGTVATFVYFNCELPPFTNRLVRRALNHAIDRPALVRALANRCVSARGPVAPTVHGSNQGLPEYDYDPAKARSMLTAAGVHNGFRTTLWVVREQPRDVTIALFVQQSLREVGVDVVIKEVSFAAYWDSIGRRRTVPMSVSHWTPDYDDLKNPLAIFNADNIRAESSQNAAFYSNPALQPLFRQTELETNPARRLAIYQTIERQIVEDAPCLFLVHLNSAVMVQSRVQGLRPREFWPALRLDEVRLEP